MSSTATALAQHTAPTGAVCRAKVTASTVLGADPERNHLCMGPAVQADDFIRCACVLFSLPTVSYSPRSCPSAQSSATYLVAGKWRVAKCK